MSGVAALPSSSSSVQTSGTASFGRAALQTGHVREVSGSHPAQPPDLLGGVFYEPAGSNTQDRAFHGDSNSSYDGSVSFVAWPQVVLDNILKAGTPFSVFVKKAMHCCKDETSESSSTALFPIPLPRDDAWCGAPKRWNKHGRLRRAYRRMLRLCILGLNYVHFDAPFGIVKLLGRRPNSLHAEVFERLIAFIKAGGPHETVSILNCGRKSHQLDARFRELQEALQSLNLVNAFKYAPGHFGQKVAQNNEKDELRPYRELNAERLKLSGTGAWDPSEHLSDLLYLPYLEPRSNQFDVKPPADVLPDLSKVDKVEVLKLCKVWDAQGLLRLYPVECGPKHLWGYSKIFNNFKNAKSDRQIGDRRGMNFSEGRIVSASKTLPSCTTLLQLCPVRFREMLACAVADRRDFYHQFKVSDARACSNAVYPPLKVHEVLEFKAMQGLTDFVFDAGLKKDRTTGGDFLHGRPPKMLLHEHCIIWGPLPR